MKSIAYIVSRVVAFFLLSLLIFNCNKNESYDEEEILPLEVNILYTQLQPNLEVTSVDTLLYVEYGGGGSYIPQPSDTTASLYLDINNDDVIDFRIRCSSNYNWVTNDDPWANYSRSISISGTSADNQIAITDDYNIAHLLDTNAVVNDSLEWVTNAMLYLYSAEAPFSTNFNGDVYLGLRMKQDQGDNFCWLFINKTQYDISVMSYAINLTLDESIHIGQVE